MNANDKFNVGLASGRSYGHVKRNARGKPMSPKEMKELQARKDLASRAFQEVLKKRERVTNVRVHVEYFDRELYNKRRAEIAMGRHACEGPAVHVNAIRPPTARELRAKLGNRQTRKQNRHQLHGA